MSKTAIERTKVMQLRENFDKYIATLLDEDDPEDLKMAFEFTKYIHSKKLKVLTAEHEGLKRWKALLLSK